MDLGTADPKGLVRESYLIEGITSDECRSIFLDWALSMPVGAPLAEAARTLIAVYGSTEPGHPMTAVLAEALNTPADPKRRGGRAARVGLSG